VARAALQNVLIINDGTITAGAGALSLAGGIGVDLLAGGALQNDGSIIGGAAGTSGGTMRGGRVVVAGFATLANSGSIVGGAAANGGYGGTGVFLGPMARITNTGTIAGGFGKYIGSGTGTGLGGIGVYVDGGTLINKGDINGGAPRRDSGGRPARAPPEAPVSISSQPETLSMAASSRAATPATTQTAASVWKCRRAPCSPIRAYSL
jgi:hypothetical protein